jgi:hypothetical protein
MPRHIAVTCTRVLPHPKEAVLPAIWDIRNIELTEVKADVVDVTPLTETAGSYRVRGHFAGVPWHGEFFYELNADGFHSCNAPRPEKGSTVEGGFVVHALADGSSRVEHYEEYTLTPWLRPLASLIIRYLRWSMGRELRDLESLVSAAAAGQGAGSQGAGSQGAGSQGAGCSEAMNQ